MTRWTIETAQAWYQEQPWLVGCNFLPSTAINQLEMWQAETFDPATIRRELRWAADLGFNMVRVYLHDLVWSHDAAGFAERLNDFLSIAQSENIRSLLVLFDDCHRPDPVLGTQPLPVAGVHNSGWKHSPGQTVVHQFCDGTVSDSTRARLKQYVQGVLDYFRDDERILMWDLYNEPGQSGNQDATLALLEATWDWASAVRPSQPLTACLDGSVGAKNIALNAARSDIISFHCYVGEQLESTILALQANHAGWPLICSEYMARNQGTTFQFSLPIFKKHGIGCFNWGLVLGESQTHQGWETIADLDRLRAEGTFLKPGDPIPEPDLWFHNILRPDGSPYDAEEVAFIKQIVSR